MYGIRIYGCRRQKIRHTKGPEQPLLELWALRLLCRTEAWELLKIREMGDADNYGSFSWLKPLRDEINWAIAVACNAEFLRTGCEQSARFNCLHGDLLTDKDMASNGAVVPPRATSPSGLETLHSRLAYLHDRLDPVIADSTILFHSFVAANNPQTLGELWQELTRDMLVERTCGKTPSSLHRLLAQLEKKIGTENTAFADPFAQNLSEIRQTFNLTELQTQLFAFLLSATNLGDELETIIRSFDFSKSPLDLVFDFASIALDAERQDVKACLNSDSALVRSGLVSVAADTGDALHERIRFLDEDKLHSLLSIRLPIEELLSSVLSEAGEPKLTLNDYDHIPAVKRVLTPYLQQALAKGRTGTNILLYGMPGTGKTQLARTVARALGVRLYEVATKDTNEHSSRERLVLWKSASSFLSSNAGTMLAIDEAEDVFNHGGKESFVSAGDKPMRTNKGEINKLLETNPVPTIWITNSIQAVDPAMIRRFNLVIEVPPPDLKGRRKIIENTFGPHLSASAQERLVQTPQLSPAVLTQACEVAEMVGFGEGGINEDDVLAMINETLRAQRFGSIPEKTVALPEIYDPSFVNTDMDLTALARGLKQTGGGRLCLYGPPGTGKSAYAAWLARELGRPLMRKTVAELSSCWVGETEKLIAETFRQAQRDNAVLLLDEADSFLRDRSLSRASWETTQVNEMLTQIESFSGYFIATTNLLDTLDPASLRRFDLKAKFDFMTAEQSLKLAREHLQAVGLQLDEESSTALRHWNALTPGDFAAVMRQSRFKPLASAADFVSRLAEELKVKGHSATRKIGFC